MASALECQEAFHQLAERLAAANAASKKKAAFDRSLSCTLSDLGIIFAGQLRDGQLLDIREVSTAKAQVKMTMSSEDLLKLVGGELHMASAWASGRVKIDAGVLDLLRLRSVF